MNNETAAALLENLVGKIEDNENNDYDGAIDTAVNALGNAVNKGSIKGLMHIRKTINDVLDQYIIEQALRGRAVEADAVKDALYYHIEENIYFLSSKKGVNE